MTSPPVASPSRESLRALDWLNFFLADVRTGVGPFLAIHLATHHWDAQWVGFALTIGGLAGVLSQVPAGALVDAVASKRALIAAAVVLIAGGAVSLASWPAAPLVLATQAVLGVSGSVLGPAVAAMTLGLVGHRRMAARVGRNQRFDSAGNLAAAGACGLVGYALSTGAVFCLAAALAVPALLAVARIRANEIDYTRARGGAGTAAPPESIAVLGRDRRLLLFAGAAVLFHFANAAMLPLLGEMLAAGKDHEAPLFMSACVMVTQGVVALVAPAVGRTAEAWGRKPVLLLGFAVLALRGLLYVLTARPVWLVSIQILDGIGVAIFGIASLLVIADLTEGTGRFNLAHGAVGAAGGIGASLSNAVAGSIVHWYGFSAGFLSLAAVAAAATALLFVGLPETKPSAWPAVPGDVRARTALAP